MSQVALWLASIGASAQVAVLIQPAPWCADYAWKVRARPVRAKGSAFRCRRDAAGVRPDPGLVRTQDDTDLTRPVTGLVAGAPAITKAPSVTWNERAAVADPVANRRKVARPRLLPRQGLQRGTMVGQSRGRGPS
jgi:hypothetical protein